MLSGVRPERERNSSTRLSIRILVHLFDQLADGGDAVARHLRGDTLGDGHHLAVHDEDPVVVAGEELLDDHVAAVLRLALRLAEAEAELLLILDADGDAAAVIAVERLHHQRVAQPPRLAHRIVLAPHDDAARDGDSALVEQLLGEVLVAGELGRDERGLAGNRGADALLVLAVAELDEAGFVEPHHRDSAPLRLVHQRLGGGAEGVAADEALQRVQPAVEVELAVEVPDAVEAPDLLHLRGQKRLDELEGGAPGGEAHLLLVIGEHHVVDARPVLHRAGLAACGAGAGQRLQLQRDMLGDVPQPSPLPQPSLEAAADPQRTAVPADPGQQLQEGVGEAGEAVGRIFLETAEIDLDADHRGVAEIMGPAIDPHLGDARRLGEEVGGGIGRAAEKHLLAPGIELCGGPGRRRRSGKLVRGRHDIA
jgi:hypothetical protein